MEKSKIEQIGSIAFDEAETIEAAIRKIEAVAYLVESIGISITLTGVPSDENLVSAATSRMSDELIDIARELGGVLDRLQEEDLPEVAE